MAFEPENFLMAERALDEITQMATDHFNTMDAGINRLVAAVSSLQAMQGDWASAVAYIDDQAVFFSADDDWQRLQARKDKIVTSFIAMRDLSLLVRDAAQAARAG